MRSDGEWTLVARDGLPLGFVSKGKLRPLRSSFLIWRMISSENRAHFSGSCASPGAPRAFRLPNMHAAGLPGARRLLTVPAAIKGPSMRFQGTDNYVATEDLKVAVNASIALERPLLVKGEPGTGKTVLAEEIAKAIGAPLITWHIKSTTKAHAGPLRVRRGEPPARQPARRRARLRHQELHQARQAVGRVRQPASARCC